MRVRRLLPVLVLSAVVLVQMAGRRSVDHAAGYWEQAKEYVTSKMAEHRAASSEAVAPKNAAAEPQGTVSMAPTAPDVPSGCVDELPNGRAPAFDNPKVKANLTLLCTSDLLIGYFGPTRTGLWSATYLTPDRIAAARTVKRVNSFHADARIPDGPTLSDYVHSGFDRGHISPSGDQPTAEAQNDSFTLANMAPQNPGLNRGPWERLEEAVRNRAMQGPLYVITGVRFLGQDIEFLKGRVGVPTTYYKMIYDPAARAAVVYEAPNREGGVPKAYSLFSWEQQAGEHFGLGPVAPLELTIRSGSRYAHE